MARKNTLHEHTIMHYNNSAEKGSTGALNSMFECAVTTALRRDSKQTLYVRGHGKVDWKDIEVKSCCSETGSIDKPLDEIEKAVYILYTPDLPDEDTIKNDCIACLESCFIFTSAQFIEMLCYIHKDGTPHIKLNKARGRYNIQTLRTFCKATGKWSEVPYKKFWDYVNTHNIENATLEWYDETH